MENFVAMKLKRKDLEDVNDDFSDFSLSSPARKIRRLDVELPPIIEEEEADIPMGFEQSMSENVVSDGRREQLNSSLEIEELPFVPENEEKAIVLFKPNNSPLFHSLSNYSIDPNLISSFKNQALLGSHLVRPRYSEEDEGVRNGDDGEVNTCRAVVPWVPSQQLDQRPAVLASQNEVSEAMDAEEMEAATMDIEDSGAPNAGQQANEYINHYRINEGLQHQWQQQHCMIPQPPQNTTTPIVWYR